MTLRTDLSSILLVDGTTPITASPTNTLALAIADRYDAHIAGTGDVLATGALTDAALTGTVAVTDAATTARTRLVQMSSAIIALSGVATTSLQTAIGTLPATLTGVNAVLSTATAANTVSTIVKRDASGDVAVRDVTARNLTASGTVTAASFTGALATTNITGVLAAANHPALAGDVTSTAGSLTTTVSSVGGKTAGAIALAVTDTTAATNLATGTTLIKRDVNGDYAARDASVRNLTASGTITGNVTGNVTGSATTAGALSAINPIAMGGTSAATPAGARTALGVPATDGTGALGTWPIAISGNAATATSATTAGSATTADNVSGVVAVAKGGTGAITAAAARVALGAAASGSNGDITALTGLTTSLSVAQGGTGGTTAATARAGIAAAASGANTDITSITGNAATATAAATVPASGVTGIHTVTQGGTGVATIPQNAVITGNGTGNIGSVAPGVSGNVLVSNGVVWTAGVVRVPDYSLSLLKLSDGAVVATAPPTMRVYVNAAKKFDGAGNPVQWSGDYLDLTSYVPGTGTSVWVMIYLNATAAIYAAAGAASATPTKPQAVGGQTPLAYVLLYAGQITVQQSDIYDWRTDFAAFAVGGGTGSGYSPVGHSHGQGGESFVAIAAMDEGRPTTPSVAGLNVYVQPTRYSDTNGVGQQFPGGASGTLPKPVSFPFYVAVGLSQAGSITLNPGAENATPVRGQFLNTTDISIAYVLVRTGSTRTILNDDAVNALIIDARRIYSFSSPAAGGVAPVSSGGTGQSAFPAGTGLLFTSGGTGVFQTAPATIGTPTVGFGLNPTVAPAGASADLFQGGGGVVATGSTNIPGTVTGLHIMASTKTGTGTIGTFNGLTIEAQTIGTTNNSLNVIGNAIVSGNMTVGGGLTFNNNLVVTATSAVAAQFNSNSAAGIVEVINGAAAATGLLSSWRVNGVEQANMGPGGVLNAKGVVNSGNETVLGTLGIGGAALSQVGIQIQSALTPVAGNTYGINNAPFATLGVGDNHTALYIQPQVNIANGVAAGNVYGLSVNGAVKQLPGGGATTGTVANAYGVLISQPTVGVNNTALYVTGTSVFTGAVTVQNTIASQGSNAALLFYDRAGSPGSFAMWYRDATNAYLYDSLVGNILTIAAATGQIAQPAWVAPTLLNGFVNFGSGYRPMGYFKDTVGVVHLRGMTTNPTANQYLGVFNLPVGYQQTGTDKMVGIFSGTAGEVQITGTQVIAQSSSVAGGYQSFSGITYDTR